MKKSNGFRPACRRLGASGKPGAEMMEQYKDLWISGHATPGYPAGHNLTPGASVLYQRPDNSVVNLTTLNVPNFAFEDREVTELIGLELA